MANSLFVSYFANWKGEHRGWLVFDDPGPIKTGKNVDQLVQMIETYRGWPSNTVTIISFQRLETGDAVGREQQP